MAAEGIPAARLLHGVRGLSVPSPRRENCIHLKANFNRAVSLVLICSISSSSISNRLRKRLLKTISRNLSEL